MNLYRDRLGENRRLRAENEELRVENSRRLSTLADVGEALAAAEALVVWLIKLDETRLTYRHVFFFDGSGAGSKGGRYDGTDADLLRAAKEAKETGNG